MADGTPAFTAQTFDTAVQHSTRPVLVDFWAPWCGPCRALAPTIAALSRDLQGDAVVGTLNVDEHPEVANRYQVRSIPTVIVLRDGAVAERHVGVADRATLERLVRKHADDRVAVSPAG